MTEADTCVRFMCACPECGPLFVFLPWVRPLSTLAYNFGRQPTNIEQIECQHMCQTQAAQMFAFNACQKRCCVDAQCTQKYV